MPDEETQQQEEESRADRLRQSQREARSESSESDSPGKEKKADEKISVFGAGLFASAIFIFFDVPIAVLTWSVILYIVAIPWALLGWLTVFFWMWNNGYGIFTPNPKKNLLVVFSTAFSGSAVGLPGLSGFVATAIMKGKVESVVKKAV